MTRITVAKRGDDIVSVSAFGHSGYAEEGSDIICAAVSAGMQLVECQLTDVLGLQPDTTVDTQNAVISLRLREHDIQAAQPALQAFALMAAQWAAQHPDYITIQEGSLT